MSSRSEARDCNDYVLLGMILAKPSLRKTELMNLVPPEWREALSSFSGLDVAIPQCFMSPITPGREMHNAAYKVADRLRYKAFVASKTQARVCSSLHEFEHLLNLAREADEVANFFREKAQGPVQSGK